MIKGFLFNFIFIFLSCAITGPIIAQTVEYLDVNNIKAGIGTGGNLFTTSVPTTTWNLFESPIGSNKRQIYTAALWLGGVDDSGVYRCAGNEYFKFGSDYFDGPVATNYDSAYDNYFKRVFAVTKLQLNHFQALSFPTTTSQVDSAILFWPGKGNPSVLGIN